MSFSKSSGTTVSERLLTELCEKTFLRLWSYPNVFRDQHKGKEICDLLVIFGNDVIIFSDKSCLMTETGDIDLDWSRWFKRAVLSSIDQIFGAERWLRDYPHRLYIDKACRHPLPFTLPPSNIWKVHRIVVANGARERCKRHLGENGSLRIIPYLRQGDHLAVMSKDGNKEISLHYQPFALGQLDPRGYVHVLDEETLPIILNELDTASDFISYLTFKEGLVNSGKLIFAAGEEELLWEYMRQPTTPQDSIWLKHGNWEAWKSSVYYQANREAEQLSRNFWDGMVNQFTEEVLEQRAITNSSVDKFELCIRILASANRLARIALSKAFIDRLHESSENLNTWRMLFTQQQPDVGYVFLFSKRIDNHDFTDYLDERGNRLLALLMVYAAHNQHLKQLVGIATEPQDEDQLSFNLIPYAPNGLLGPEDETIRTLQEALGIKTEDINAKLLIEREFIPGKPPHHSEK